MMSQHSPEALLFIATGCQHCPSVLQSLGELVKTGALSKLEVINIQQNPLPATELNVRSVPWVRIGPFELTGLRTKKEFEQWIQRADDPSAMGNYFGELMLNGEIHKVHDIIQDKPEYFPLLFDLMADPDTSLSVRIGIGAVVEDFAGSELLIQSIEQLGEYTKHPDNHVRTDACHYLGLSRNKNAINYIQPLLNDDNEETREVAAEALEEINEAS